MYGSCQNMPVVRIGQIKFIDKRFVSRDEGIGKMCRHRSLLRQEAFFDLRHREEDVPCPFAQNLLGPTSEKYPGFGESEQYIPLPVRV